MQANYKKWTDFLVNLGIEKIPHSDKSYLAHLVSVYRLMEAEGCDDELCRAGMFHSIYGTEKFQGFEEAAAGEPAGGSPDDRRSSREARVLELREWIGPRSIGFWIRQASRYRFTDRITGGPVELARARL